MIQLFDAGRRYGPKDSQEWAVRGARLTVEPGQFVVVMGPSGSGKTSLLNMASGIDLPDEGSVLISRESTTGMSRRQRAGLRLRLVGTVSQDDTLLPELTATENAALRLRLLGVSRKEAELAADQALATAGLGDLGARFPGEMSGGERQRVGIARALAGPGTVMVADEPTGSLDEIATRAIFSLLSELAAAGRAILCATHDPVVREYATHTVTLAKGQVPAAQVHAN